MKKVLFLIWSIGFLVLSTQLSAQVYTDATQLTMIGKAEPTTNFYHRVENAKFPDIPQAVKNLLVQSAGLAVVFKTNSNNIYATWTTKTANASSNISPIGQKGLNLYIKRDGIFQYAGVGQPTAGSTSHSATLVENMAGGEKECIIYLPLYEEITDLKVGVTSGSTLQAIPNPFRGKVIVYGSSITQGASAARTGLAYPSIMGRNTGIHYINIGLSGSAKMEPAVADMLTSFDADAYILDCVPNANSGEITSNTASLVKKIRNRHPISPIIMIQSVIREIGNFNQTYKTNVQTQNNLFMQEYNKLVAEGITGLTMITAENLLGHDHEGSVDGTHPNDLGFERMVQVIQPVVTPIINAAIEAGAADVVVDEPDPEKGDYEVSTLAGGANVGDALGTGTSAAFRYVQCMAFDSKGNLIVSDRGNHKIKKITPQGVVSLVAGTIKGYADGDALTQAMFGSPYGIAIDANDNIFVADIENNRIRKITPDGVVSTVAGSTSGFTDGNALTQAQFKYPIGLVFDKDGNLLISDYNNHSIRKLSNGVVTTLAGNGTSGHAEGAGSTARLSAPVQGVLDADGNLLVPDRGNHCIRKVTPSGVVTTVAGIPKTKGFANGNALGEAMFNLPSCIALDIDGSLLVADHSNHRIARVSTDGQVTTVSGTGLSGWTDGYALQAAFTEPYGLAVNAAGEIFVGEMAGSRVRKMVPTVPNSIPGVLAGGDLRVQSVSANGLSLSWDGAAQQEVAVSLYSSNGVLLLQKTLQLPASETVQIPVSLDRGVYVLLIQDEAKGKQSVKFVF